jgi:hypothetical protein
MYFPKITTNPHDQPSGNFIRITARRKNGDSVFVFGESLRQVRAIKRLLMKSARHFNETLLEVSNLSGLGQIKTVNDELIACLSSVPDPYAPVDRQDAADASVRDARIIQAILAHDPTIEELFRVMENMYDWQCWWRCNHPTAEGRERFAKDLDGMLERLTANRERYEQIKERRANGTAN